MKFWAMLGVAAGACFLVAAGEACADTILAAESTWEYTATNPTGDSDWNTTTGGGWATGQAPFGNNIGGSYDANFDYNTYWAADSADGDDLWVRTSIDLTGYDLTSIAWGLGVDNGFKLYLNGNLVASANGEGYTSRWEYGGSISSAYLVSGVNVVAVALEDHGGLTAFDMQITGTPTVVPLPPSALMGVTLLGGLGLARVLRKRRQAALA